MDRINLLCIFSMSMSICCNCNFLSDIQVEYTVYGGTIGGRDCEADLRAPAAVSLTLHSQSSSRGINERGSPW